jgi:hypothetical protein
MKKLAIILLLSSGLAAIGSFISPPFLYADESLIPYFMGQVFAAILFPALVAGLLALVSRSKKIFFPTWVSVFCLLGTGYLYQKHLDKNELIEGGITSQTDYSAKPHGEVLGDFYRYSIGPDVYKFPIPESYADATLAYQKISEDPRLFFSLACHLTPEANLRGAYSTEHVDRPEFLKIDILKDSKSMKVSEKEFRSALSHLKSTLPSAVKRGSFLFENGFEIANDQIKKVYGTDSGFEVVSVTNLGFIHEDERSILWTQLMPFELTLDGEINRVNMMAVLGAFFLDGRVFYITSAREFQIGKELKNLETETLFYLQNLMKSNPEVTY